MSLHDVDKSNSSRITSILNASDDLKQRMAHNTNSTTYKQEGDTNTQRIAFKNGLILYYDGEDRVSRVDGWIPELSNEPVIIIAESGYDVYVDILGLTPPTV